MKLATILPALCLTATLSASILAQPPQFTDPANLRGERVKPRDGRELPIDTGALGLQQLLRKLNTRASILNIVAHPDDEDGGMLTLYARGLGARVTDLSLTRGEGGQNAMTGDFEDALGLLRTQELLANDRYTGVDQLFGTEVDFGFSKTKEEAFTKWTHERVLYDAVRAIRLVRPLVITATFIGGVTDGHGQHQVSGQIAQEAFVAAADPNVFPDMIAEGILPWQALRVYARVPFADINAKGVFDYATGQYVVPHFVNYVTGKLSTIKPPTDVIVPEGTPDPLFTAAAANPSDLPSNATATPNPPLSYAQFSRIGLFLQRSQIGKDTRLPTAGIYDSGYTLYGSALCADHNPIKNCLPDRSTKRPAEGPATTQGPQGPATTQVPRGFSLGSHGPSPDPGFSPQGMLSPSGHGPNFFTGIDTSIEGIATLAPAAFSSNQLAEVAQAIRAATNHFDPTRPEAIAPDLARGLTSLDQLIHSVEDWNGDATQKANALHELRTKRVQLNDALALSLNINLNATLPSTMSRKNLGHGDVYGFPYIDVETLIESHESLTIDQGREWLESAKYTANNGEPRSANRSDWDESGYVPATRTQKLTHNNAADDFLAEISRPYFHRDNIEQPVYELSEPRWRNAPAAAPSLVAWAKIPFDGTDVVVGRVVHESDQPIRFVSAINISFSTHAQALPLDQKIFTVSAFDHSDHDGRASNWHFFIGGLSLPPGYTTHSAERGSSPDERLYTITDQQPSSSSPFLISAYANARGGASNRLDEHVEGYRPIGYGDLPRTNYYTPATTRIVPVDLKLPAKTNIAYLPGTGDAVPEALASITLTPTILTVADLTPTNLAKYDTVILGVRTYSAHPDLHGAPTQALLDYARNGGNVVVQYQTPEFTAADAPYPLSLGSNEKVVDETAPVVLLSPGTIGYPEPSTSALASPGTIRHPEPSTTALASPGTIRYPEPSTSAFASPGTIGYPKASALGTAEKEEGALAPGYALLTTPNRITSADFNNWIEERGHGFLSTWDAHYTALTETHDPGAPSEHVAPQLPQRGGLITTPLGRGRWTYVAFALYRQLPEAVPGAYRLFLNLLNP